MVTVLSGSVGRVRCNRNEGRREQTDVVDQIALEGLQLREVAVGDLSGKALKSIRASH